MKSPALINAERLHGYLNGSRQTAFYDQTLIDDAALDFILMVQRVQPDKKDRLPYGQGYLAGVVARWCGVNLWPVPDAVSVKPYSINGILNA